jgi:translation initiation factor IF-2
VGDYMVAGNIFGRVRAIADEQGKPLKSVSPGMPAEVMGFGSLPEAGDHMKVVPDDRTARSMADAQDKFRTAQKAQARALTLEEVINQIDAGDVKELNLVLKADVQGSVEAVQQSLEALTAETAKVRILHAGSGAVTESDVLLASASGAIVIGFTIGAETSAERLAHRMGVEIRHYDIIYQLVDDMQQALNGMLEPVLTETLVGRAEIREVFSSRRGITIAGCRVTEGRLTRGGSVRVLREGKILHDSVIASLRHFREEVNEITNGADCGVVVQGYNDFQEGDILEVIRQDRGRS